MNYFVIGYSPALVRNGATHVCNPNLLRRNNSTEEKLPPSLLSVKNLPVHIYWTRQVQALLLISSSSSSSGSASQLYIAVQRRLLCKGGAAPLPQVNLRTHRPAAFDSSSSILPAEGGAGREAEANAAHQREERPWPLCIIGKNVGVCQCVFKMFFMPPLFIFSTSLPPPCQCVWRPGWGCVAGRKRRRPRKKGRGRGKRSRGVTPALWGPASLRSLPSDVLKESEKWAIKRRRSDKSGERQGGGKEEKMSSLSFSHVFLLSLFFPFLPSSLGRCRVSDGRPCWVERGSSLAFKSHSLWRLPLRISQRDQRRRSSDRGKEKNNTAREKGRLVADV